MKLAMMIAALIAVCGLNAAAQTPASLTVKAEGIDKDGIIDPEFAFCVPAASEHVKEGKNKSIGLAWSKGPEGTKSYAIIGVDPDVPASFNDANKEGRTIAADMPRRNFYHWVLVDIPAHTLMIPAYTDSQGVVKRGKAVLRTPYGTRGVNDYAAYFADNPDRSGVYAGYDGPCPPWNDERIHRYHFKVFALDVETLNLPDRVAGVQAMEEIGKHTLAEGEVVGKYTLNPTAKK